MIIMVYGSMYEINIKYYIVLYYVYNVIFISFI